MRRREQLDQRLGTVGGTASLAGATTHPPCAADCAHDAGPEPDHSGGCLSRSHRPRALADGGTMIISGTANVSCGLGHAAPEGLADGQKGARRGIGRSHAAVSRQGQSLPAAAAVDRCAPGSAAGLRHAEHESGRCWPAAEPLHERAPNRAALLYSYRVCSPIGFSRSHRCTCAAVP
jgi:hypothetical protein